MELMQPIAAVALNLLVAAAARYKKAVTRSGAVAGFISGSIIYLAGAGYWLVLILFFLSSTLFGKLRPEKRTPAERLQAKGAQRDAWQVVANIGPAVIAATVLAFIRSPAAVRVFAAVMAAATADTWSSEIGVLSNSPPVSILTLKPTLPGLSGAISTLGLIAGGLGALVSAGASALAAVATGITPLQALSVLLTGSALGVAGTLLDSLLGATVQAQYRAPGGTLTERSTDTTGTPRNLVRGARWVTNDIVNLASTSTVAVAAVLTTL